MAASPIFRFASQTGGAKYSATAGATVTATLVSTDSVNSVTWSVVGTDETRTAASYTLTQSGSVGQQVQFTAGAAGTAVVLKATINGGVNPRTGDVDSTMSATAKCFVPTANGVEVVAFGEGMESSSTHGWAAALNPALRLAGSGTAGVSSVAGSGRITSSGGATPTVSSAALETLGDNALASSVAITDADQTITVSGGKQRTVPTSMAADRVYTLGTSGASTGDTITVRRTGTARKRARFLNGGAAGGIFELNSIGATVFRFDGTNWAAVSSSVKSGEFRVNVLDFGARGDGSTDDSSAIQAAIDAVTRTAGVGGSAASGVVYFPKGIYRCVTGLTFTGDVANVVTFEGDAVSDNAQGSQIRFAGTLGGTLFRVNGGKKTIFSNLELWGASLAAKILHLGYDSTNGAGADGAEIDRCVFSSGNSCASGTVVLAIGDAGTAYQVSRVRVRNCTFSGDAVSRSNVTAWRTLNSGNVKNFSVEETVFSEFYRAIDWENASGNLYVCRCEFANVETVGRVGNATAVFESCALESGIGTRILDGVLSPGQNPSHCTIIGGYWDVVAPSDDYVITYGGNLTLIGNTFINNRTGSTLPKLQIGDPTSSNGPSSLVSHSNWFQRATVTIPVYDGSGNNLTDSGAYTINRRIHVESTSDMGGIGGAMERLRPYIGTPPRIGTLMPDESTATAGGTWGAKGEVRQAFFSKTYSYTAFQGASATKSIDVIRIPAKCRLVAVYLETTAAFTGTAGGVQLRSGSSSTGQEFILAHDVKTAAVTKGLASGDLGATLAAPVQGAGAAAFTFWIELYIYMQEMGGNNLSGLSAGSVTVHWIVEQLS